MRECERVTDRPVQHLSLVTDQAVVAHFLRQRVRESIGKCWRAGGPLDETCGFKRADRRPEVHVRWCHLRQHSVIELRANDRCHARDLERLHVEVVEARPNDALNGFRQ